MNEVAEIIEQHPAYSNAIELSGLIYNIRGKYVMLDRDLAILYANFG